MAKLSRLNIKVIDRLQNSAISYASIIARRQAGDPSLPEWYLDKPIAFYEGMLAATYGAIEEILHTSNAYRGYGYRDSMDAHIGKYPITYHLYFVNGQTAI